MRNITSIFGLCALLILTSFPAFAVSKLEASLDRNPVMVGETFTLTIIADAYIASNRLDTSSLLTQFIVGSTSMGTSTRVVNGDINQQTTWNIRLTKQQAGRFTIPSFTLDGVSSQRLVVEIIDQPKQASTTAANDDIKLEANFSQDSAYVGQHLLYQIKLYIDASLQRAQLQAPVLEGADITPLGEDSESSEIVAGRRYRVITRHYTIVPNQAGSFTLQGSVFRGDVRESQRNTYFNNGRSKPITIVADSKPFVVHPIPKDFPGQWLVSEHVVLEDAWSSDEPLVVGQPVTRTLTLTVANASVEQLPQLDSDFGPGLATYPDKKTAQQGLNGTTLIAQSVQKVAIIPSKAGSYLLPEIRLPWFNSQTKALEWAIIGAKKIEVIAAANSEPTPTSPNLQPSSSLENTPQDEQAVEQQSDGQIVYWQLATVTLLLLLLLALFRLARADKSVTSTPRHQPILTTTGQKQLQQAMIAKDDVAILRLFPIWLKQYHQMDLAQLTKSHPELAQCYQSLAQNRFGQQQKSLDYRQFSALLQQFVKKNCETKDQVLTRLYQ